jgi:alpha-ketoglutarate-dependent taurine dioxygenase
MAAFTITPMTEHTGAAAIGIDFTQPIDAATRSTLNDAWAKYHVLVMRDHNFAPVEYKRAAAVFGELQPHDKKERHVPGHPDVYYTSRLNE